MPPKDVCEDCRNFDSGRLSSTNNKFYCDRCWDTYNSLQEPTSKPTKNNKTFNSKINKTELTDVHSGNSASTDNNRNDFIRLRNTSKQQCGKDFVHSTHTDKAIHLLDTTGLDTLKMFVRSSNIGDVDGSSIPLRYSVTSTAKTTSKVHELFTSDINEYRLQKQHHSTHVTNSSSLSSDKSSNILHQSLLTSVMRNSKCVMVTSSSGGLSPRGGGSKLLVGGGLSRGNRRLDRTDKIPIDMLMTSVDDLVSLVYVNFDEDLTKAIISALDEICKCPTTRTQDDAKLKAVDELVQILGSEHFMLMRCLCDRPRDVLLKLMEEFCSLDEADRILAEENEIKSGGYGATVRIVQTKKSAGGSGSGMGSRLAQSMDEKWLSYMNKRFKQLTESSELDEIFRKDFSIIGGNMPKNTKVVVDENCMRFNVPPAEPQMLPMEKRIHVANELPAWSHPAFTNVTHLNTIQTEVFHTAFHSNENMMICAPTGAGKTMVALLVMLRCIQQQFSNGKIDLDFKMIFIAPMKALAQEMVANFSKRLAPFMLNVRELTGDMQLTKSEIASTQLIVTTPEKWDVVTRKPENEIARLAKLIIIDEIHLLNDERGPVIEAIVARTLRMMETESSAGTNNALITRLVGLSATLPNYKDVALFLNCKLDVGLKVFGPEYRPVPLEQCFIAVHDGAKVKKVIEEESALRTQGDPNEKKDVKKVMSARDVNNKMLDLLCYQEVVKNLKESYQVMVFVHARKQTVSLAKYFIEKANEAGETSFFKGTKEMSTDVRKKGHSLQGKDLSTLFNGGVTCHHAGLIRYDRSTIEGLFREGHVKVLVCTSTLAWGVNLPAHTVIIRGTEIYDPKRGGYVSLSVLDVLQIFGRAGRPQYDTSGLAIIISGMREVSKYIRLIAHSLPIESKMQSRLCDHLNAEIHSGTISSISEGLKWLEYTYLWRRIRVNPLAYGLTVADVRKDNKLHAARYHIISSAATSLAEAGMIRYNQTTGSVDTTDIGRIASHYYIDHLSIRTFNELMRRPDGSWSDKLDLGAAMNVFASANEFSQLRARQDELDDLQKINLMLPQKIQKVRLVGESADETGIQWKVTTLLKAYISRIPIDSHSLVSDTNYVVQNAGRIARALFEIEVQRSHPHSSSTFLTICKSIERRCWDFEHPLTQFECDFPDAVRGHLNRKNPHMSLLREMCAKEIGGIVQNIRIGTVIENLVKSFPCVEITAEIQPITRTILRVKVTLKPSFFWNNKYHGGAEHFWLFVEDSGNNFIFHHEMVVLTRKEVMSGEPIVINLTIPIIIEYHSYVVRVVSDRWLRCEDVHMFSVDHLHLPDDVSSTTKLLPMKPLGRDVIPLEFHAIYQSFTQLNSIQTQVFHPMFHTDENVFLGAPTGSGKTISAEMAVLRALTKYPGCKIVYIAPLKALVKERLKDWGGRFDKILGRKVVELSGDVTPDITALANADILCTTPEKWDGISRNWQVRSYVTSVKLVIFDEIHMLGNDRGPIIEVIVSRMRYIGWHKGSPIRLVGLSTAVANPGDIGAWLGVSKKWAMFNFEPSVRPVPMRVHIAGYPGRHYCPRMAIMNKPTYNAIVEKSPTKPVIVFVSSRRQTRLTALALINFLMLENNTAKFVRMTVDEVQGLLKKIDDPHLKHCIQFGIAIHHAGLQEGDKSIVEEAFRTGKLQILVATSTLAWGVNFPAHLVIVKGTEYYDGKTKSYVDFPITDVLQMIGRAGRPQFDTEGIAQVLCHEPKKGFFRKFLYDPFPVESALHKQLHVHINAEIVSGTIATRQDAIDYLTWTYLFRRLVKNPSYYGLDDPSPKALTIFLSQIVCRVLSELEDAKCIEPQEDPEKGGNPNIVQCTVLGKLCSYYYLSHTTAHFFNSNIFQDSNHVQLMRLMCEAQEFAELPVRHNEDKLNLDLAQYVPIPIDGRNAESPHVKAFLIFQAHFERCTLPVSDYYTDQRSAIDNSIRVLQAMVDIAANSGHLYAALKCMNLLQCIIQGRWWHDNTLLQLPHMTKAFLPLFEKLGVTHIAQLANANRHLLSAVEELIFGCVKRGTNVSHLPESVHLSDGQADEVMYAIRRLPLTDVYITVKKSIEIGTEEYPTNTTFELTVDLTRLSIPSKFVVAPLFSKQKDEQYWIAVGNEATGELVAIKRLNRLWRCSSVILKFDWDDDWATEDQYGNIIMDADLQVYVIGDSFIGLDQQYTINVNGSIPGDYC